MVQVLFSTTAMLTLFELLSRFRLKPSRRQNDAVLRRANCAYVRK